MFPKKKSLFPNDTFALSYYTSLDREPGYYITICSFRLHKRGMKPYYFCNTRTIVISTRDTHYHYISSKSSPIAVAFFYDPNKIGENQHLWIFPIESYIDFYLQNPAFGYRQWVPFWTDKPLNVQNFKFFGEGENLFSLNFFDDNQLVFWIAFNVEKRVSYFAEVEKMDEPFDLIVPYFSEFLSLSKSKSRINFYGNAHVTLMFETDDDDFENTQFEFELISSIQNNRNLTYTFSVEILNPKKTEFDFSQLRISQSEFWVNQPTPLGIDTREF
jgi:hypothetical protein